jgi:hypothetical protein
MQSLEVLDIAIESLNSTESSSLNVTLPHLRIFGCSDGSEGNLLGHLTLPALRTIEILLREPGCLPVPLTLGVRSALVSLAFFYCPEHLQNEVTLNV